MKKLLLFIFILINFNAYNQKISGYVYIKKDKKPLPYATVALLKLPDSTIVTGVITLSDGKYTFENIKQGNYYVKINYLGYKPNGKNVSIKENITEIIVDTIFLEENIQQIEEAVVVGKMLKGKEMVDRTVYSIPEEIAKSSNNGYDILKKIPQVQVDFQNNVTLNGSKNFIIQVDGKQRDKEFLAKLLPSDIQSIEIITNPSGKYEGNIDGIINIILKKEARYGINGNLSTYIKPFNKLTGIASGSIDYGLGNITFYVTTFIFKQKLDFNSFEVNKFLMQDSASKISGIGEMSFTTPSINSGFDWYLNDKNNLSLNIQYRPVNQIVDFASEGDLYNNYTGDIISGKLNSISSNKNTSDEGSISLFYKKTFKKPIQELTIENIYYLFNSEDNNRFSNITEYIINQPVVKNDYSRFENNINKRNYLSSKINYVHPIGLYFKFEAGYHFYYQEINYKYNSNIVNLNNIFTYNELRNSTYAGITANFKKIGFQSIIRIENTNSKVNNDYSSEYTCILPTFNLQYKVSSSHNIKFTYNRRINRPGTYDLNPFQKIDAYYNISQGNPYLKPEYRNRFQLTYTCNLSKNYISPYIYYEKLTNRIGSINTLVTSPIDSNTSVLSKPYNVLNGYEQGAGLNAMFYIINVNARIFQGYFYEYKDPYTYIPSRKYSSYSINGALFYKLEKQKLTAYIFLAYNGVNINAQSKTTMLPFYGIGLQKELKNNNFGLFWLNPFSTENETYSKTITETDYLYKNSTTGVNISYFIQFTYSYKFNKGKSVKKISKSLEIESDTKVEGIKPIK